MERVISGAACIAEGAAWLSARDARLAVAMADLPPLPLRLREDGFAALLAAICGQQVSTASAAAINARLAAAGLVTPQAVAAATEDDLRACGLSRAKMRYARALAEADIDYAALRDLPAPQVIDRLTAITGIGRWTAQIYTMFSLGRADVFAEGDLALQEAARLVYDLPARPDARTLAAMAQAWSPWRSVAARILWAYYKHSKQRDGIG